MTPQQSQQKTKVFVDYTANGLWGVWFNTMRHFPNVLNPDPVEACITAGELLEAAGKEYEFMFSEAVVFLHCVRSGTFWPDMEL